MDHAISIRDGRDLAGCEEPESSVESPDMDVPPTLCQGSFSTIRHMDQIPRRNAMTSRPATKSGRANAASALSPRSRTNPVKSHTHLQQVARCIHVHIAGGADGYG